MSVVDSSCNWWEYWQRQHWYESVTEGIDEHEFIITILTTRVDLVYCVLLQAMDAGVA